MKNKNTTKNIMAVLITALTMTSVAYYAQAKSYGITANNNDGLPLSMVSSTDIQAGVVAGQSEGSGRTCIVDDSTATTYCGDSAKSLIWAIRTNWEEDKPQASEQAPKAPKLTAKPAYVRKGHNESIMDSIRLEAQKQGYDDVELALDIADCESLFDPNARNNKGNTPSYSTDWGLWQYNDYWQRNNLTKECMLDVECSTRQAIKDLKAGKAHQWSCYRKVR